MPDSPDFFSSRQSDVLKWTLVGLAVATSITLVVLLIVGIICDYDKLRNEISAHLIVIIGLAGMGMASVLLVAIARRQNGPIEVEGLTFKFKSGAGAVILWIMGFPCYDCRFEDVVGPQLNASSSEGIKR